MASLHDLQVSFVTAVRTGDAAAIALFVVPNGIAPARRIAIYANNASENFLDALEAAFPVVTRLAGRDWFRQTGRAYWRQQPSRSGNLHDVGERYAAYLTAELGGGPHGYFADVARLERAYQEVLVAAEPQTLDLARLAAVPPEAQAAVILELSPAARLVASPYPLLAIWQANQVGAAPVDELSLDAGAASLLVIRRRDHVELRDLSAAEFAVLTALERRDCLTAVLEAALAAEPGGNPSECLARLAQLGAVTGFHCFDS
jgi:hypothetical protein